VSDHLTELLIQAQAGDSDAFESLHEALAPGLRRFAERLIGDAQEADDIVQDSLLTLFLTLERIDPPEYVRAYVYRIVRNRCYDALRRFGRREAISLDREAEEGGMRIGFDLPDTFSTPPEEAANWLLLDLEVRQAIDQLPENQRQTLLLYADSELSYEEISAIMDVSIGTVKSRLFHARRTLRGRMRASTLSAIRDALDEDDDDDEDRIVNETSVQAAVA